MLFRSRRRCPSPSSGRPWPPPGHGWWAIDATAELKIETVAQSDIIRSLRDTAQKAEALSGDLEQIPLLLQSGKDAKAAAVLTGFADLFDILCRTISLCALFPQRFADFFINGKKPADFLEDFSPVLSDFEKSLADSDTVLTGVLQRDRKSVV